MEIQKNSTSQKAIIFNEQGKILVIKRSKTSPTRAGYWDLPGGILEAGEDKKEAIIREIKEEEEFQHLTALETHKKFVKEFISLQNEKRRKG